MTRRLPWKRVGKDPTGPSTPVQPELTKAVSAKRDTHGSDGSPSSVRKKARRSALPSKDRSRSTSPAPQPLVESFMIEGLEADDRYRMVEDELLSVAQQFTAHLHAVEYQRLRETLKSRNARTVQDIPRPVVGSMTGLVRRKQERKAHAEKQRLALKETLGNHDDTDGQSDHYRDTSLYGLMENPMKKATRLDKLPITSTATRAAAGFEESSYRQIGIPQTVFNRLPGSRPKKDNIQSEIRDETSSGDDDLDGPAPGAVPEHIPRLHESIVQPAQTQTKLEAAKNQAPTGNSMDASEKATLRRSRSELSDSSDDAVGDFFSRLQNRRASLKSNRERRKHGSSGINREPSNHDVIPGFL